MLLSCECKAPQTTPIAVHLHPPTHYTASFLRTGPLPCLPQYPQGCVQGLACSRQGDSKYLLKCSATYDLWRKRKHLDFEYHCQVCRIHTHESYTTSCTLVVTGLALVHRCARPVHTAVFLKWAPQAQYGSPDHLQVPCSLYAHQTALQGIRVFGHWFIGLLWVDRKLMRQRTFYYLNSARIPFAWENIFIRLWSRSWDPRDLDIIWCQRTGEKDRLL